MRQDREEMGKGGQEGRVRSESGWGRKDKEGKRMGKEGKKGNRMGKEG